MKERPIILTGQEVNGVREGRKTQTRLVVECEGIDLAGPCGNRLTGDAFLAGRDWVGNHVLLRCPYGERGDRLWVREKWCVGNPFDNISPSNLPGLNDGTRWAVDYAANPKRVWHQDYQGKWRPSIHMQRWASRITLEITAVRVERLQDVSEEDAVKEGCDEAHLEHTEDCASEHCALAGGVDDCCGYLVSAILQFKSLWQSIHGPGSWDANPWVWVLEFKRVEETK